MAVSIERLAVNAMIAPVMDFAERMRQAARPTDADYAEAQAAFAAMEAGHAGICQGCGGVARLSEGSWWDCDACRERALLDEPDYAGH